MKLFGSKKKRKFRGDEEEEAVSDIHHDDPEGVEHDTHRRFTKDEDGMIIESPTSESTEDDDRDDAHLVDHGPKGSDFVENDRSDPAQVFETRTFDQSTINTIEQAMELQRRKFQMTARSANGPLPNPEALVTSQLFSWKFTAEQGSAALRIPAVLCAIGLMTTTLVPYFIDDESIGVGHIILSALVLTMAFVICFLDGRFVHDRDPLGFRAKLRNLITRHFNVFKLVWGRGLLYMAAGLLNLVHEWLITDISGGLMILVGIVAVVVGSRASRNLANLRSSLTDDTYLWLEFSKHDKDDDGYLTPLGFAHFLHEIGLELDDLYTLKAFNTIDIKHERKISFEQFKTWWSQCKLEAYGDDAEATNYRAML